MEDAPAASLRWDGTPRIAAALIRAVYAAVEGADRVTVLYSGGVDSSIVAHLARRSAPVTLLCVGTEGAADLAAARAGARALDLPLTESVVSADGIWAAARAFPDELDGLFEPARSVALATAVILRPAPDRRVLWGQGADELFFGYARYRALAPELVRRAAEADLLRLTSADGPRAVRIAGRLGHELRSPFLDPEVLAAVGADPPPLPRGTVSKPGLRRLAIALGVPAAIATRPKRALQYGSGVHRVVRARARLLRPADPGPRLAPEGPAEGRDVGDDEPSASGREEA